MTGNISNKVMVLLVLTLFVVAFNSYRLGKLDGTITVTGGVGAANAGSVVPTGIPSVYGKELGISYDDISPNDPNRADSTIRRLAQYDMDITLAGANLERYINILYYMNNGISCEYCCGARAVIFENGEPACGCAHSYSMRGLAKYLITKHGNQYSDEQILEEVAKWKTLYFPGQIQQKAAILQQQGIETSYTNLASNKYRGIEQGQTAGSGMVGGC